MRGVLLLLGIDSNAVTWFYTAGIAAVLLAPVAVYFRVWPVSAIQWALPGLLGTLGMIGHTLLTIAHRHAEASVLAPTVYSQIIYITLPGWLVFGSVPTGSTIAGAVVIVLSGLFIWWRERRIASHSSTIPLRSGR